MQQAGNYNAKSGLPTLAGAINGKCRDISGKLTMEALGQAAWTRQWDFLTTTWKEPSFDASQLVTGIKASTAEIAGRETLVALNNALFVREWNFLRTPAVEQCPIDWPTSAQAILSRVEGISGRLSLDAINAALLRQEWQFLQHPAPVQGNRLVQQAASIRALTRNISGQLTMQALAEPLRLMEDWQFLRTYNDPVKRASSEIYAQAASIRRLIAAISGELTASALKDILYQTENRITQRQGDEHDDSAIINRFTL